MPLAWDYFISMPITENCQIFLIMSVDFIYFIHLLKLVVDFNWVEKVDISN